MSLETEGHDTSLVGLVEGGKLLGEIDLGDIGATRVEDVNDELTANGFGEVAGSALLAATTYRMMLLRPKTFADPKYVKFADGIRKTLGALDSAGKPHVTSTGIVTPAVNPLNWKDTKPVTTGSPEAQVFVVLMYAAWRDCVLQGICKRV